MEMIHYKQFNAAIEGLEIILERENRTAITLSLLGLALAKSGKDMGRAISLCEEAIEKEKDNASFYLNLSEVFKMINRKDKAVATLQAGIKAVPGDKNLFNTLNHFGIRTPPTISFLDRSHPINKFAGKVRAALK